ncbi:uncharacterized protein V6R79_000480 [Siganus canaliculatus]
MDVPNVQGQKQEKVVEFQRILLRLTFPTFYNSYTKTCCKLYPGRCYKLLDSAGYTCDFLKGRVTRTESDGWIEFEISNVLLEDAGYYRCSVLGTENHVYSDYYVQVSEVHSQSEPSPTTIKPSAAFPESTGPVLAEEHGDSPRVSWSFGLSLAIIVSITSMILITSVIGVVWCRVKTNSQALDKYGETQRASLKQEAPEMNSIVYTTVDFRAHQKPPEVYANLKTHKTQVGDVTSKWRAEHSGMVEYSILAFNQ